MALGERIDHRGDRVEPLLAHLVGGASQRLMPRSVHEELRDQPRPFRLALVRLPPKPSDGPIAVLNVLVLEHNVQVRLGAPAKVILENRQEQGVLTRKVRVHGALRVPGLLRDLIERSGVQAATQEHRPSRLDELRLRPLLALRA